MLYSGLPLDQCPMAINTDHNYGIDPKYISININADKCTNHEEPRPLTLLCISPITPIWPVLIGIVYWSRESCIYLLCIQWIVHPTKYHFLSLSLFLVILVIFPREICENVNFLHNLLWIIFSYFEFPLWQRKGFLPISRSGSKRLKKAI